MENYAGIMRKIAGIFESAPRGERPAIIALRAHAFCACNYVVSRSHTRVSMRVWLHETSNYVCMCIQYIRVYFSEDVSSPLYPRALLAYA